MATGAAEGTNKIKMGTSDVLENYLNLLKSDFASQLRFQLARNSVLDWFGRSIPGPVKIHEYLRSEIIPQFEHAEFQKAEECAPIECKPTHFRTKKFMPGDVDYTNPKNKVTGISSLKPYADSDVEEEPIGPQNEDIDILPAGHRTPDRTDNNIIEPLTPPTSKIKLGSGSASATDEDEPDNEEFTAMKAKRLKRTHTSSPFTYLRRLPTTAAQATRRKPTNRNDVRTLLNDSSSEEEGEDGTTRNSRKAMYTPLRYLEAAGVLQAKRRPQSATDLPTCSVRAAVCSWDRAVRIRISYRQRLTDGQPQFALVLYEHLENINKAHPRRNLMSEFSASVAQEQPVTDGVNMTDFDGPIDIIEEQPSTSTVNAGDGETLVPTVVTASTEDIVATLEAPDFTIAPLRTPTKVPHTPPATPKRKPRLPHTISGLKRLNLSPSSTPKRSAARSLRL